MGERGLGALWKIRFYWSLPFASGPEFHVCGESSRLLLLAGYEMFMVATTSEYIRLSDYVMQSLHGSTSGSIPTLPMLWKPGC